MIVAGLRWSARITGLVLAGMVVLFAVGEGIPNVFQQPVPVQLEFLAMGLMCAGFLAGWRWEVWGGTLALLAFAAFVAIEVSAHGKMPGGVLLWFGLPGALYLLSFGVGQVRGNHAHANANS